MSNSTSASQPALGRPSSATIHAASGIGMLSVFIVALIGGFQTVGDWDFWWHLSVGEWIFTHGAVPTTDVFSWSFLNAPWHYRDAGAELLWYLSWHLGGFAGVAIVRTVAIATAAGLIWRMGAGATFTPLLLAFVGFAAPAAWLPRPLLAGSVGLLLLLALMHRQWWLSPAAPTATDDHRGEVAEHAWARITGWWAMAATLALWFQLHRSAVIGVAFLLAFVGLYGVRLAYHHGFARSRRELAHALAASSAALLTGLCTPNGWSLYQSTLSLQGNEQLQAAISEWQPMTLTVLRQHYAALAVLGSLAALAALAQIVRPLLHRQWDRAFVALWPAFVLGVLVWQTSGAVRHAVLVAVASVWVLAAAAGSLQHRLSSASGWSRAVGALLGGGLAIAMSVSSMMHPAGVGPVPDRYPSQALAFARDAQLGERVHNSFVYGGYVLWQSRRDGVPMGVLIDGRNETVYPVPFYLQCVQAQYDPQAFAHLRASFVGDWVLADNTPGREAFGFLFRDPQWALVYWSEQAVVYVPRDRVPDGVEPFRFLDPVAPAPSLGAALQATEGDTEGRARLDRELERMLDASPTSMRALALRLLYLHSTGRADSAEFTTLWDRTRATHPSHPMLATLRQLLGRDDGRD